MLLDAIPTPMFLLDRKHCLIMANDAFCDLIGRPRENIVGNAEYQVPDEQKAEFFRVDEEVFSSGQPNENEERLTTARGELRIILTRKCLIHLPTSNGEQPFILATTTDVTRFREAEARAQHLAEHDPLTGLANRTRLTESLSTAIEMATKVGSKIALLLIDLDGFKAINDQYGHLAGDEVLKIVAKRLTALVRSGDTLARLGGDEFCIVQTIGKQPEGAMTIAERILSSFSEPVTLDTLHTFIGASVGISIFPEDGDAATALIQSADMALYEVKRSGRCGYQRHGVKRGAQSLG